MKPTEGVYRDCEPVDQPPGTYRKAVNMVFDEVRKAVLSEDGFLLFRNLGKQVLGTIPLDGNDAVVFCKDYESNGGDAIYLLRSNSIAKRLIEDSLLNLTRNHPIDGVFVKNHRQERVIVWTDNHNPPRILNVDNLQLGINPIGAFVNPADVSLLELFASFRHPRFVFDQHNSTGGSLLSGAYFFAMAYEDEEGSYTAYSNTFGPVVVTDDSINEDFERYDGTAAGTVTSKSIRVTFEDVDRRYLYAVIAAVRFTGGVPEAFRIARVPITGQTTTYDYTGNEGAETLLLEEVLLDKVAYLKAKTLDLLENRLYLGNLTGRSPVNWQQYANQIKASWIFDEPVSLDGTKGSHKDEVIIYNRKGFMPGEVYALYAVLNFTDGSKSDAFHIPGRAPGTVTINGQQVDERATMGYILNDLNAQEYRYDFRLNENARYFQLRDTSGADGTMGYWENTSETYPDNVQWGDLAGQPVRHHRFPDLDALKKHGKDWLDTQGISTFVPPLFTAELFAEVDGNENQSFIELETIDLQNSTGNDADYFVITGRRYRALQQHTVVLSGLLQADSRADLIEEDIENPTTATVFVSVTIYDSTGQVVEVIANETRTDTDARTASANADASLSFTYTLEPGWEIVFEAEADALNADFADLDIDLNATVSIYEGLGSIYEFNGQKFARVLGLRLSNIIIPEELKDVVQSVEIYYAKRTTANSTILGHAMLFYASTAVLDKDHIGTSGFNGRASEALSIDNGTYSGVFRNTRVFREHVRLHPFDFLETKPGVVPTHLAFEYAFNLRANIIRQDNEWTLDIAEKAQNILNQEPAYTAMLLNAMDPDLGIVGDDETPALEDKLRGLNDAFFIPADTLTSRVDNRKAEEAFVAELDVTEDETWIGWDQYNSPEIPDDYRPADRFYHYIVSLRALRFNVYETFTAQPLISTGAVVKVASEGVYAAGKVYGGDVFNSGYGFRLSAPRVNQQLIENTDDGETYFTAFVDRRDVAHHTLVYHPVISAANIGLRHEGLQDHEVYYPKTNAEDFVARPADAIHTNNFSYNDDYSRLNETNTVGVFNLELDNVNRFPYRIIRSRVYNNEAKNLPLRSFAPNDYYEMVRGKGEITALRSHGQHLVIITEYAVFPTVGKEQLATDQSTIELGTGDIFRFAPREIVASPLGYGGSQHLSSCFKTKSGVFLIDDEQGKVFLVGGELSEISNRGLRNYFREDAGFDFVRQLQEEGINFPYKDAPGLGVGFVVGFDEVNNRIIVSKLDKRLKPEYTLVRPFQNTSGVNAIIYDGNRFFVQGRTELAEIFTTDEKYFETVGWTWSYSLSKQMWVSEHTYQPEAMATARSQLYLFSGGSAYRANEPNRVCQFFSDTPAISSIDVILNGGPEQSYHKKFFQSLIWITEATVDEQGLDYFYTFTKAVISNGYQCSGIIDLNGRVRQVENEWRFNDFRDISLDNVTPVIDDDGYPVTTAIDDTKPWYERRRFTDRYIRVKLICDNVSNRRLFLFALLARATISAR